MRINRAFLVLASSGLLGAAFAGIACAVRRAGRSIAPFDWELAESDLLCDLVRVG